MIHCDFDIRLLKSNVITVLFWEGGRGVTKKRTLFTLLIMLTLLMKPINVRKKATFCVPQATHPRTFLKIASCR